MRSELWIVHRRGLSSSLGFSLNKIAQFTFFLRTSTASRHALQFAAQELTETKAGTLYARFTLLKMILANQLSENARTVS